VEGLAPGPGRDPELRDRLAAKEARRPGTVHRLLRRFDKANGGAHAPERYSEGNAGAGNLSAVEAAGSGSICRGRDALTGYRVLKIGLFPDRAKLVARLEARVETMFASGLVAETEAILARGGAGECEAV